MLDLEQINKRLNEIKIVIENMNKQPDKKEILSVSEMEEKNKVMKQKSYGIMSGENEEKLFNLDSDLIKEIDDNDEKNDDLL